MDGEFPFKILLECFVMMKYGVCFEIEVFVIEGGE